jgi:hypothetical protein
MLIASFPQNSTVRCRQLAKPRKKNFEPIFLDSMACRPSKQNYYAKAIGYNALKHRVEGGFEH